MNEYLKNIKSEITHNNKNNINEKPKIAVITPLFNQGHFLEDTIKSVVKQTYKNWEMVICEDCSTDNSFEVAQQLVQKYAQYPIKLIRNPQNLGVAKTRNNAIKNTNTEYFLPLDADDMIAPTFLEECMETMLQSGVDIVYTDVRHFGGENKIATTIDFDPVMLFVFNYISVCSLFKRKIWETVGGYNNQTISAQDYNFVLRAVKNGFIAKRIPKPIYHYRILKDGMFASITNSKSNWVNAQLIVANNDVFTDEQIKWAELVLQGDVNANEAITTGAIIPLFEELEISLPKIKQRLEATIEKNKEKQKQVRYDSNTVFSDSMTTPSFEANATPPREGNFGFPCPSSSPLWRGARRAGWFSISL